MVKETFNFQLYLNMHKFFYKRNFENTRKRTLKMGVWYITKSSLRALPSKLFLMINCGLLHVDTEFVTGFMANTSGIIDDIQGFFVVQIDSVRVKGQ